MRLCFVYPDVEREGEAGGLCFHVNTPAFHSLSFLHSLELKHHTSLYTLPSLRSRSSTSWARWSAAFTLADPFQLVNTSSFSIDTSFYGVPLEVEYRSVMVGTGTRAAVGVSVRIHFL